MSKDSNVAGGSDKSSQNPFGFISDFFEGVFEAFLELIKSFTDLFSGNSRESHNKNNTERRRDDVKGEELDNISPKNLSPELELKEVYLAKEPISSVRRSSLGASNDLSETIKIKITNIARNLFDESRLVQEDEESEKGSPFSIGLIDLFQSQLDASNNPRSEEELNKNQIIISLSALAFTSSDQFRNFLEAGDEVEKKNILKQYLKECFSEVSFNDDLINEISTKCEDVFIVEDKNFQDSEISAISLNQSNHYEEYIKKFANMFFGIFLSSSEYRKREGDFFKKSSKEKKDVLNQYFEKNFGENPEDEDKLFKKFPDLLDAIVDIANDHNVTVQSFRVDSQMRAEKLSSPSCEGLTPN